uniref:APH domain-containing protein n=1 Tax=Ganoderma boninense TaxID=34458 RepID=A0A5K1K1T2_9APHY|nr:APH domain-containing protein [Ganoderma boninense]
MADSTAPPTVDRSSLDFEVRIRHAFIVCSLHLASNPVSRRASPIPLTSVSASSVASEEETDTGRSDWAQSGYGSSAGRQSPPAHITPFEAWTFGSSENIRIIRAPPIPQPTVIPHRVSIDSPTSQYDRHTQPQFPGTVIGDVIDGASNVAYPLASIANNDAWASCVKALRDYDEHIVKGWKEDVDSLLVFAGLFSAVLTAFNIESYKLLQEDPTETSAALLAQISAQLASNSGNARSALSQSTSSSPFRADNRSIRINILWFSSLVLSLVSASIGILTKQWMREYMSNTASSHRENARIRQLRHEGFVRWNVPLTIALLPILLQIAMALFFAGLLDLLWSLHAAVAWVVTVLVTISLSFLVFTTVLPTFRSGCPYKSPQAMSIFLLAQGSMRLLSYLASRLYSLLGWDRRQWPIYVEPTLFKRRSRRIAGWLRSLMHRKYFKSWREREKAIVRQGEAKLDHRILAGADAIFMDDDFLENVVRACINDTDCPAALDCVHEIINHRADGMMDGVPHWRHSDDLDGNVALLLHLVADVLPRIDKGEVSAIEKTLLIADRLCRAIPFEDLKKTAQTIHLYQRVFVSLSVFLVHQESVKRTSFELMRSLWARMIAPVPPSVIQSLTMFARAAKQANEVDTFHLACEMALVFSTRSNLPRVDFNTVRTELQVVLEDLEGYLTASDHGVGAIGPGQSASILLALEELAVLDPDLISTNILRILDHVRLDPPSADVQAKSDTDSMASFLQRRLASARALRKLRHSRPRWQPPAPQRRKAVHVRGPEDLQALNLTLPKTPEKEGQGGQQRQQQLSAPASPLGAFLSPIAGGQSPTSGLPSPLPSRPSTVPEDLEPST